MELLSAKEIGSALGCTDRAVMNWVHKGELSVSAIGKTSFNKPVNLFDLEEARQARHRLLEKKGKSAARTLGNVRRVVSPGGRHCFFEGSLVAAGCNQDGSYCHFEIDDVAGFREARR